MALPDTYRPSPHCPSLAPCCLCKKKKKKNWGCALTIVAPMPTIRALMIVRTILRGEEKYRPQLRCNQYTPPRPTVRVSHCQLPSHRRYLQLNQLANSALIKLNKLLKLGIPSAMIQAIIQQIKPMATQEPTETRSRPPMR